MKFIASEYGDQLHTAVLHLDESHPHVHFTSSLAIMKWLLRAEETGHQRDRQETRSQEGHAVVPRRLLQPSFRQCGHTRLGPRRQRLTRAEWKGQQEYAIKIAAAESAVLDSAAREDERSERESER